MNICVHGWTTQPVLRMDGHVLLHFLLSTSIQIDWIGSMNLRGKHFHKSDCTYNPVNPL
jgi:hypothetical protein